MRHRIFYSNSRTRIKKTIDGEITNEKSDHTVYHIKSNNIKAIRSYNNDKSSEILYNDGSVIDTHIYHVREMKHKYEQYILGYGYYATSSAIGFYGEYDCEKKSEINTDNIQINNDTIICGEADYDNNWSWDIKKCGDSISISIDNGELAAALDSGKCVIVGSDEPIDRVCLFDPIN